MAGRSVSPTTDIGDFIAQRLKALQISRKTFATRLVDSYRESQKVDISREYTEKTVRAWMTGQGPVPTKWYASLAAALSSEIELIDPEQVRELCVKSRASVTHRPRRLTGPAVPTAQYLTLDDDLHRLLPASDRHPYFEEAGYFNTSSKQLIIYDIICHPKQLRGEEGVTSEEITGLKTKNPLRLPRFITRRANRLIPTPTDRPNAFVRSWDADSLDQGGILTLELVERDRRTQRSIDLQNERLRAALLQGEMPDIDNDLERFPGHLSVGATVESNDGRLILCLRSPRLAYEARQWSVGIGGTMCPNFQGVKEHDEQGPYEGLHPTNTIIREANEELAIREEHLFLKDLRYFNVGMSCINFSFNMFCHLKVDLSAAKIVNEAAKKAKDPEHNDFDHIPFTFENCVDLVVRGLHKKYNRNIEPQRITSWSRLGVLFLAGHRYGFDAVHDRLKALPSPSD